MSGMALVPTENEEKSMASDVAMAGDEGRDKPQGKPPASSSTTESGGFFHVYKPGQGYWTRMGTAGAALLIAVLFINFLFHQLPTWLRPMFDNSAQAIDKGAAVQHAAAMASRATLVVCGVFLAGFSFLVFWLMNKPDNADFLIATDSEMKKVNWTSKKELWGSTKIVIIFMFLIATMLFSFDIIFGYLFYFMGVLKSRPL